MSRHLATGDVTGVVNYAPQPDQTEFSAISRLRPCACGCIPEILSITESGCSKWAWASCGACGEWAIEFRTGYSQDPEELERLAVDAWNRAPRQPL